MLCLAGAIVGHFDNAGGAARTAYVRAIAKRWRLASEDCRPAELFRPSMSKDILSAPTVATFPKVEGCLTLAIQVDRYGSLARQRGRRAMHGFIKQFGVAFTPEAVSILTEAFDDAWARLQASRAPYGTEDYALAGRTILAKHIIMAARKGEWNPDKLANDALLHLSRQKVSRVPPGNELT